MHAFCIENEILIKNRHVSENHIFNVFIEKEWDDKFVVKRNPTTAPEKRSNSNAIGESSIIAISVFAVCILITFISVSIGIVFYKRKLSKKVVEKVLYSRGFDLSKESSNVFVGQQDSVKVFGLKRNGRLESSSFTSSTMPLMHRQNSYRTRLPSNIDADLNEGAAKLILFNFLKNCHIWSFSFTIVR